MKNNLNEQTGTNFDKLVQLVEILRSEDGCDWDKAQTNDSLIPYFIEEVYELIDSIDKKDSKNTKEELGDVMLHLVFQTQISNEKGLYTINDVLENINKKLVERHPHVFNQASHSTFAKVNWESQKHLEKKRKSRLDGVPQSLPALTRAHRLQQKASHVGFDWDSLDKVWRKFYEEIDEVKTAYNLNNRISMEEEIGDLLFSVVNLARHMKLDSEDMLRKANKKFIKRFRAIEKDLTSRGKDISEATLDEMDSIWEKIKKEEN